MSTRHIAAALLCAGAMATAQAWADEQEPQEGFESFSLGEIYIKGEKPSVVKQTTVTNEITAEDIKATGSNTVAEALSHVTGVRVSTGRKNEPSINIRGLDQSRVLVLIDGIPYYETNYGKLDLNQIPTENIAKIEVTKGAASILYGANALAGVVNIVTKQPTGKPFFEINAETGEIDYYKTSVSHGAKYGIFSYWLNYSHSQTRGWELSNSFKPRVGTVSGSVNRSEVFENGGLRSGSNSSSDSVWAKFGIEPVPGSEYYVNFFYIDRDKGVSPNTINNRINNSSATRTAFSWFADIPTYKDWGIDLSGQQKVLDILTLKEKVFYHRHIDEYASYRDLGLNTPMTATAGQAVSKFSDYTIGGSLTAEIKAASWNTLRLVGSYRGDSHRERGESNVPYSRFFSFTGSAGLEDEISVKELSVVLGFSYDWFHVTEAYKTPNSSANKITGLRDVTRPDTMSSFNPMMGITYNFSDGTKAFASVARKTRFPTLQQLYSSTLSGQDSNSDLKPEIGINTTVGVSRPFSKYMWSELAFYYNHLTDFISRDNRDNAYQNTQKVEMYGIELNSEFYLLPELTLKAGYTYNHAADRSSNAVTKDLVNVPEHKLDLGISYTVPTYKTRLDMNGTLMSSVFTQLPTPRNPTQDTQKVSGYFIFNTRITQPFLKHYEAYLHVNNILDKYYESEYGFPAPGRNIFGGVTARF